MTTSRYAFYKTLTLPATLAKDAFYFVSNVNYAESYLTDANGVAKAIGNSAMINDLIDIRLNTYNTLLHVQDIASRDSLLLTHNAMVLVTDATGDATVANGAALYFYDASASSFTKVAEYESMDVIAQWQSISGRPNSAVIDIDDAVASKHSHPNRVVLDSLSDDGAGNLHYSGHAVGGLWSNTDW